MVWQNNEKTKRYKELYDAFFPERKLARDAKYRANNNEQIKARKKLWRQRNLKKILADVVKRKAAKLQRTPKWLTKHDYKEIKAYYQACPEGFHVDHIIPLLGKTVSGLHVLGNLQYLPGEENLKKGNKYHYDTILRIPDSPTLLS